MHLHSPLALLLLACAPDPPGQSKPTAPSSSQDSPAPDSASPDSGGADGAGPADSGQTDSAPPDSAPPDSAPPDSGADSAAPDSASPDSGGPDSAPPDSAPPEEPPYCRSLDLTWRDNFVEPIDQELADLIERERLLGDPMLYVDDDGNCLTRELPEIGDPMAQLGRALFFSMDLSGDQDVACATCHHPLLGGGDALPMSVGPAPVNSAMGADRAALISDVEEIFVPRNATTTFNIAFWDDALFWDARVRSLSPAGRFNGEDGPIATPDSTTPFDPDPGAAHNLTAAQAAFPLTEEHEMAGTWRELYESDEDLRAALAARLLADPDWVARFEAACAEASLPEEWAEACALPAGPERSAALVTSATIIHAIGEYERSQNFTETPWKAYVQGDVDAISPAAKEGALLFFRSVRDGGHNCFDCHSGDLFTDEQNHAIGSPQIGPGKADSTDRGRGEILDNEPEQFAFRTPTLLNVEVTAPYTHAGAYPTLRKAIEHYDNPFNRLQEYFGRGRGLDTNPKLWCEMPMFAQLEGCDALYTIERTAEGDINAILDHDVPGIRTLDGDDVVLLEAFLRTLTDPRVKDPAALADWIEPDSELAVTETSSPWEGWCDVQMERSADVNLHVQGLRWLATGEIVGGDDINADLALHEVFGLGWWRQMGRAFTVETGLPQEEEQLAIAVLELLSAAQLDRLVEGYLELEARGNAAAIRSLREEIYRSMNDRRGGAAVSDEELVELLAELRRLEAEDLSSMVALWSELDALVSVPVQEIQRERFVQVMDGDLSSLPAVVYSPGAASLSSSPRVLAHLSALPAEPALPWASFAASYLTWSADVDCRLRFLPRQRDGDPRAAFFGYQAWAGAYLFDLQNGLDSSEALEGELSGYMSSLDAEHGLNAVFRLSLSRAMGAHGQYRAARDALAEALLSASAGREAAVLAASADMAEAEAELLLASLDYYTALGAAEDGVGSTRLSDYVTCIESSSTQAMRGAGGFVALGGGSCAP